MKGLVIVGVIALVAVGMWFAKDLLVGSDGAKSPEAAVKQLADALDSEDPAGVAVALAPDEVRSLGDVVTSVESQAKKSGLNGKRSTYSGLDVEVSDLDLEVEKLGPDTARVTIRDGKVAYTTKGSELAEPVRGMVAADRLTQGDISSRSFEDQTGLNLGRDPYLITVKRNGGWYVSLTYTTADYLVRNSDGPEGDFDEEVKPAKVEKDPEDAVVAFAESIGNIDVDDTSATVSQPEWSVLHAYKDAIEDAIEQQQDEGNLNDVRFSVGATDLTVEDLTDDSKKVIIDSASGSVTWAGYDGDESRDWEVRKGCLDIDGDDPACLDNGTYLTHHLDVNDAFVVVNKERGGWAVSPMSTAIEYAKQIVPKMSAPVVLGLLGHPELIEPKGRLDSGKPVEVKLDEAGYASYTLTPSTPRPFVLTSSGLDGVRIYDRGGDEVSTEYVGSAEIVSLDKDSYRVVAQRDEYNGGQAGMVTLTPLRVEDLASSGASSGRLTSAQPVIDYRFRVPSSDQRTLVIEQGEVEAVVLDGSGNEVCYADVDSSCDLATGEDYRIRVYSYDDIDGSATFAVRLREEVSTVDGAQSASGFVTEGDFGYHAIHVASGQTAVVFVGSSDGTDIDFNLDGQSFSDVGDESVTLGPGDYGLEVYAYPSSESGSYTVTVSRG